MTTEKNTATVRRMKDGTRGNRTCVMLIVIGVILFLIGFRYERFEVGGLGAILMILGAIMVLAPSLWTKIANRPSMRYFRSVSQVIWRKDEEAEHEDN